MLLIKQGPTTVHAARVGEPTLTDPQQTTAPQVRDKTVAMFNAALKGEPVPAGPGYGGGTTTASAAAAASSSGEAAAGGTNSGAAVEMEAVPTGTSGGNSTSVEIVNPSGNSSAGSSNGEAPAAGGGNEAAPGNGGAAGSGAAPEGAGSPAPAPANPGAEYGLKPVGPTNTNAALPAVDKPAAAPDQVNDVKAGSQPAQVQTGTTKGKKNPNVPVDKSKESSTKKKKKGLDKLNPF